MKSIKEFKEFAISDTEHVYEITTLE
jgi:hypothetical protein